MSLESDIKNAITGDETVSGMIGSRFAWDVIYGTRAEAPYIVAQIVSEDSDTTHDGAAGASFPLIQFSCWAKTRESARALGAALRALLVGQTISGTSAASFSFANRTSAHDPQTRLFGELIDMRASLSA